MRMQFTHSMLIKDGASRTLRVQTTEDLQTKLRALNARNREFWATHTAEKHTAESKITMGDKSWV